MQRAMLVLEQLGALGAKASGYDGIGLSSHVRAHVHCLYLLVHHGSSCRVSALALQHSQPCIYGLRLTEKPRSAVNLPAHLFSPFPTLFALVPFDTLVFRNSPAARHVHGIGFAVLRHYGLGRRVRSTKRSYGAVQLKYMRSGIEQCTAWRCV